jgi:hypothetical protein
MVVPLETLVEWFILSVDWRLPSHLAVRAEDHSAQEQVEVEFHQIAYFRVLASNVAEPTRDNEIWRFEELETSTLLDDVVEENGRYSLKQMLAGEQQSQHSYEPALLRHIVMLSDYLHFEVLCTGYTVTAVPRGNESTSVNS